MPFTASAADHGGVDLVDQHGTGLAWGGSAALRVEHLALANTEILMSLLNFLAQIVTIFLLFHSRDT